MARLKVKYTRQPLLPPIPANNVGHKQKARDRSARAARPYVYAWTRPHFPACPVNAPAAEWRVSACFKRKARPRDRIGLRERSGGETHFGFSLVRRLADDPPKLRCDAIQHRTLFLHAL